VADTLFTSSPYSGTTLLRGFDSEWLFLRDWASEWLC